MKARARLPTRSEVIQYLRSRSRATGNELQRPEEIDLALWSIMRRGLSASPKSRHPDAEALADELFDYLVGGSGTRRFVAPATVVTSRQDVKARAGAGPRLSVESLFGDLDLPGEGSWEKSVSIGQELVPEEEETEPQGEKA